MFLIIARTFKEGFNNLIRNGWLSIAAVSILVFSLYVISLLFIVTKATDSLLQDIQNRVNVSVYFRTSATEDEISNIKTQLSGYSEIRAIDYISREKALEDFKRNNEDEPVIVQSLEELGENPLLASLVIKANDPNQYESVVKFINESPFKDKISRINYGKNKEVIDKLNNVIGETKKIGLSLVIMFSVISVLIVFNTIRITIYTHRSEIEVMRLVGASNTFIRLPFIFEGMMYSLIATLVATGALFITLQFVAPYVSPVIPSKNIMAIFQHNILLIVSLQLILGILLGVLSSMIAIRKYLKI